MKSVIPVPLSEDEGQLARLACRKFAGMIEGAITIGLPILLTGQSDRREFLGWRFDIVRAYATVLHTVSGPTQGVLLLRDASALLIDRLGQLQQAVQGVIEQDDITAKLAQTIGPHVVSLFDAVEAYGALIGLAPDKLARSRAACELTVQSLGALPPLPAAPTG
jgi:hypothetical protein